MYAVSGDCVKHIIVYFQVHVWLVFVLKNDSQYVQG